MAYCLDSLIHLRLRFNKPHIGNNAATGNALILRKLAEWINGHEYLFLLESIYQSLYVSCYFFGSSFFSSGFGVGNLNCGRDL
jgi:hypothetical protein